MGKNRKKLIANIFILIGLIIIEIPMIMISSNQIFRDSSYRKYESKYKNINLDKQNEEITAYQEKLSKNTKSETVDPFLKGDFNTVTPIDLTDTDGIFAYIAIPKIELKLPIYLGASDANLENGAAHVYGTSLPVGGVKTRSVIAGHYSRYNDKLFRNINLLKEGDMIYIKRVDKILIYKVSDIEVIGKGEPDKLLPRDDSDTLTLITCIPPVPYNERLLVNAKRVGAEKEFTGSLTDISGIKEISNYKDNNEELKIDPVKTDSAVIRENLIIYSITILIFILIILVIRNTISKIKNKNIVNCNFKLNT